MNKIFKNTFIVLISPMLISSCINFEEINTNQMGVTAEMGTWDGVALGAQITALQKSVIPVGTQADGTDIVNKYQTAYNLGPDVWSGYFGQNGNWNSGRNHTTYSLYNAWIKSSFQSSYSDVFSSWLKIKTNPATQEDPLGYALAQVLKISAWHKTTDMFGPIPYTKAGTGLFVTPYDSQEEVYKVMLKELEENIEILTNAEVQGKSLFPSYDIVYAGNLKKWIKYSNSLMLRLAMRVRFADEDLAKTYAEKAIAHSLGVMTLKDDMAQISKGAGLNFVNNIKTLAYQYNEASMSVDMFSYMVGYKDPRLQKYFNPSESSNAITVDWASSQKYLPFPPGLGRLSSDNFSKPNIQESTPTYWMKASEVYFLRAEGALKGWAMGGGTAEDYYKKGISMSFEENGITTANVDDYMNSNLKPIAVDLSSVLLIWKKFDPTTEATVKFEGTEENKLEKIMVQKWLALYPNGMEAWSEHRRTSYPKLQNVMRNYSGGAVDNSKGVRRMSYFVTTRTEEEQAEYEKAVVLLGGEDSPATNLWWDCK